MTQELSADIKSEINFSVQNNIHAVILISGIIDNISFFEILIANPLAHIVQIPTLHVLFLEKFKVSNLGKKKLQFTDVPCSWRFLQNALKPVDLEILRKLIGVLLC